MIDVAQVYDRVLNALLDDEEKRRVSDEDIAKLVDDPRIGRICQRELIKHHVLASNYFQKDEGEEGYPILDCMNHRKVFEYS